MLSDTASFSEGIVRIDSVINGRIRITEKDLETLVNGPVNLEISEKKMKSGLKMEQGEAGRCPFLMG